MHLLGLPEAPLLNAWAHAARHCVLPAACCPGCRPPSVSLAAITSSTANVVVKPNKNSQPTEGGWSKYRIKWCPTVMPSTNDDGCATLDCPSAGQVTTSDAGDTCPLTGLPPATGYTVEVRRTRGLARQGCAMAVWVQGSAMPTQQHALVLATLPQQMQLLPACWPACRPA